MEHIVREKHKTQHEEHFDHSLNISQLNVGYECKNTKTEETIRGERVVKLL